MRIDLLGPLRIRATDDREVAVAGTRLRGLAILLALNTGKPVPAERVADALWTGQPPSANTVQSLVSRLRGVLGDRGLIETGPGGYRLVLDESDVDLNVFERLAATGRQALSGKDFEAAAVALREALSLWRGDTDELSAVDDRAAVRAATLRESVLDDLTEAEIALGNAAAILPGLRERATAHPFRERLQAQLLLALSATGANAEALARYETVRELLAEELGADPGPALAEAHRTVLRAEAAPPAPDHNLPAPLTSFIGRDADVAALEEALATHRLVTVTGPGGSGKTRLAVHAAHRIAATTEVRLAELAPVTDGAEVPHTVVAALGLNENSGGGFGAGNPGSADPGERIAAAIRDRPLLLVVDNCEHLLDAVATLAARLLSRCPRLRLLVTSREPLRLTGELVHPVPELSYPNGPVTLAEADTYPAVRLLAERGASANAAFRVDADNLADVVEICQRLDGLPLAIELAAARLRALTPHELAQRLGERFRLLTGGDRAALPRQRTLRAVVDWSWDILDEPERRLLARMSVFVGTMSLESIEAVCGDERDEIAYTLASLVDKSLVSLVGDRYRMLETIREYGAEKLADLGEAERQRHRHGEYFADLTTAADPKLRGPDQVAWMARLTADQDDIVAAARRGLADRAVQRAARIVAGMLWFWWLRSQHTEANALARQVVAADGELEPREAALLTIAASFDMHGMAPTTADPRARLADAARLRDEHDLADSHPFLKILDLMPQLRGLDPAALMRVTLRLSRDRDPWIRGCALNFRGNLLSNLGRLERSEALNRQALELFHGTGDRWGIAVAAAALSDVLYARGDLAGAKRFVEQADRAETEFGIYPGKSQVRTRLVYFLLADAPPGAKLRHLESEIDAALRFGNIEMAGFLHMLAAQYLRHTGEAIGAREHLAAGRQLLEPRLDALAGQTTGPPDLVGMVKYVEARFSVDDGVTPRSQRRVAEALAAAARVDEGPLLGQVLEAAAELERHRGDLETAALRLGQSALAWGSDGYSSPEASETEARLRAVLGDTAFDEWYRKGRSGTRAQLMAYFRG